MTQAQLDAALVQHGERITTTLNTQFAETREYEKTEAEKRRVLTGLQTYIDGNPGDDVASLQFKGQVQDLILAVHNGVDKTGDEMLAEAAKFNEARMQVLLAQGGDRSVDLGGMRRPTEQDPGQFSMYEYLTALSAQIMEQGEKFDGEAMTGAPELEFSSELMNKNPWAQYSVLRPSWAKPAREPA